jgi:DNA-binding transcriptional MerR regulator
MNIKQAAARSGLSIDTIRFYEKCGMLPKIARDTRGWRSFSDDNFNWLVNLQRLRATGMPLKLVRRFAVLVHAKQDDKKAQRERLEILTEHASRLERRRGDLDACEAYLKAKIEIYSCQKE